MDKRAEVSASNFDRIESCPASLKMTRLAWAVGGLVESSEDAIKGDGRKFHEIMATGNRESALEFWETEVATQLRDKAIAGTIGDIGSERREVRLYCDVGDGYSITGMPDYIGVSSDGSRVLIDDTKFGFISVDSAERNRQMMIYACLAMANARGAVSDFFVSINQPHATEQLTIGHFSISSFASMKEEILKVIKKSESVDIFNADEKSINANEKNCRYCPARNVCVKSREGIAKMFPDVLPVISMPTEKLVEYRSKAKIIEKHKDEIDSELKRRMIENNEQVPGLKIVHASKREFSSNSAVYEIVKDAVAPREFIQLCKVGIANLETLLWSKKAFINEAGKPCSQADTKKKLKIMLDPITVEKSSEPRLMDV